MGRPGLKFIHESRHIALYPSLVAMGPRGLACAWYEYGSGERPARSDVWCAAAPDGRSWSRPVNVSRGLSYNNGPSLLWTRDRRFLLAWHSWRPPGRGPFFASSNIANIWCSRSEDGEIWDEPRQAFPGLSDTEYAALSEKPDGTVWMVLLHGPSGRFLLACSKDGRDWQEPGVLPDAVTAGGKFPDLAIDDSGTMYIVYAKRRGLVESIRMISSDDGARWGGEREIMARPGVCLARPKISTDGSGRIWLSAHSNHWGSFRARYEIRLRRGKLKLTFASDKSPGNAYWAVNAVEVVSLDHGWRKSFSFGPVEVEPPAGVQRVDARDCLYDPRRGYGFDRVPEQMVRELGDAITRTVFCSMEPRSFVMDVPSGTYEVTVTVSSWVASRPGLLVTFENADVIGSALPPMENDRCYVARLEDGASVDEIELFSGEAVDNNRPSRVVCRGEEDRVLAWTRFGSDRVGIAVVGIVQDGTMCE